MSKRVNEGAVIVFILGVVFAIGAFGARTGAQPAALFLPGHTYGIITGCFPIPQTPCYGEKVKVIDVRADGWFVAKDEGGTDWFYNPAQIISFRELETGVKAK